MPTQEERDRKNAKLAEESRQQFANYSGKSIDEYLKEVEALEQVR